jgi:hypothetical protein
MKIVTMKLFLPVFLLSLASTSVLAGDNTTSLTLSNHKFSPAEVHVKANTTSTVTLINNDDQAEEFDSTTLRIEKIVAGHSAGTMRWRPLAPGRYPFMGEFHSDTAQGIVVAE